MTIDPEYYEEVSRAAISAMDAFAERAPKLAAREVEERSPDGRIIVRVTAAGAVTAITLRNGVLRRYDSATLGELIAKTLSAAQRRARAEFESAMMDAIPDEVEEANRLIRESARDTA
jgi:DNA-binding protein YbaB